MALHGNDIKRGCIVSFCKAAATNESQPFNRWPTWRPRPQLAVSQSPMPCPVVHVFPDCTPSQSRRNQGHLGHAARRYSSGGGPVPCELIPVAVARCCYPGLPLLLLVSPSTADHLLLPQFVSQGPTPKMFLTRFPTEFSLSAPAIKPHATPSLPGYDGVRTVPSRRCTGCNVKAFG